MLPRSKTDYGRSSALDLKFSGLPNECEFHGEHDLFKERKRKTNRTNAIVKFSDS